MGIFRQRHEDEYGRILQDREERPRTAIELLAQSSRNRSTSLGMRPNARWRLLPLFARDPSYFWLLLELSSCDSSGVLLFFQRRAFDLICAKVLRLLDHFSARADSFASLTKCGAILWMVTHLRHSLSKSVHPRDGHVSDSKTARKRVAWDFISCARSKIECCVSAGRFSKLESFQLASRYSRKARSKYSVSIAARLTSDSCVEPTFSFSVVGILKTAPMARSYMSSLWVVKVGLKRHRWKSRFLLPSAHCSSCRSQSI